MIEKNVAGSSFLSPLLVCGVRVCVCWFCPVFVCSLLVLLLYRKCDRCMEILSEERVAYVQNTPEKFAGVLKNSRHWWHFNRQFGS